MYRWQAVLFFVLTMCLGWWISDRSWGGKLFVYLGKQRSPAAVRSLGAYSVIDREALNRTVEEQLMAFAEIYKDEGLLGVQLGHPIVNRAGSGKSFSCQVEDLSGLYDRIEVTFVGTGISENGETPKMIIDSKCRAERDLNELETIWIPMQAIMDSEPRDQQFEFPSENLVKLRLESIPSQWPQNWVMWSVRFYSEGTSDDNGDLVINAALLRRTRVQLPSFDWKSR
jgi:hypothetical protein